MGKQSTSRGARAVAAGSALRDLTGGDLARLLEVDLKTIHNWVNQGHVFARRTEGRHLRFQRVEVVRFLRRFGYPVPPGLGRAPPRIIVHRQRPRSRGARRVDDAGLFETVLEVASGEYEVMVLLLDLHDAALTVALVRALRARPETRCLSMVGVSRKPSRRTAFVGSGGDVALATGRRASVAQAARWLTGGAERPPRGAVTS